MSEQRTFFHENRADDVPGDFAGVLEVDGFVDYFVCSESDMVSVLLTPRLLFGSGCTETALRPGLPPALRRSSPALLPPRLLWRGSRSKTTDRRQTARGVVPHAGFAGLCLPLIDVFNSISNVQAADYHQDFAINK